MNASYTSDEHGSSEMVQRREVSLLALLFQIREFQNDRSVVRDVYLFTVDQMALSGWGRESPPMNVYTVSV